MQLNSELLESYTSLGERTRKNLSHALKILKTGDCALVGTASNYLSVNMKEFFGEKEKS